MRQRLDEKWNLSGDFGPQIKGSVPGDITSDLWKSGIIKDPYFGMNHCRQGWISWSDFVYKTTFDIEGEIWNSDEILLEFEGIDTFAEIYLNGTRLGETKNMFLKYTYSVKELVKRDGNRLEVKMHSTRKRMEEIDDARHHGIFNSKRLFVRKAQCHFGWDWAPDMPGYGIYKPVYIRGVSRERITDVSYWSYNNGSIVIVAELNYNVRPLVDFMGKVICAAPQACEDDILRYSIAMIPGEKPDPRHLLVCQKKVQGERNFVSFKLEDPKLWWPVGYGEQPLYCYRVELLRNGKILDVREGRAAFRKICLEQKPIGREQLEYKFVINDVSIFAKGSNWVPAECLTGEMRKEKYERLLSLARDGNMNMLRVWGGGIYEDDVFYDICDRLGIMVWQDMMFACSDIPEEDMEFVENVKQEINYQIRRLRNHPSIVYWSGCNEKVGALCRQENVGDYFLDVILRGLILNLDSTRPYAPQSPSGVTDICNDITSGDQHASAFENGLTAGVENYRSLVSGNTASFLSECAVMGPGTLESLRRFFPEEKLWPMNEYWDDRLMDNPYGAVKMSFADIQRYYADTLYGESSCIEEFICKGMTVHAELLRAEIEYARSNKGRTWGFMNWMYSDIWPSGSWSIVDYYCEPKQAYYQAKRSFSPVLLTFVQDAENKTVLTLVNDSNEELLGEVEYGLKNLDGEVRWKLCRKVDVHGGGVLKAELDREFRQAGTYLYAHAALNGKEISTVYSFDMWKSCCFESDYDYQIESAGSCFIVTIKAYKFAKGVTLYLPENHRYLYTDNYFDLEAGEERTITINGTEAANVDELVVTDFAREAEKVTGIELSKENRSA